MVSKAKSTDSPNTPLLALDQIGRWVTQYTLTPDEAEILHSVLTEVPEEEWQAELKSEIEAILASRKIAQMESPTAEDMKFIRDAFAAGQLPVKSLPID